MKTAWHDEIANNLRDPAELLQQAASGTRIDEKITEANQQFATKIPLSFLDKIKPGDPNDALLKQVIPSALELVTEEGYSDDPVGDIDAMQTPGLLHKYHNRVLFITTGACAIHCRYCFRRHFPYNESSLNTSHWPEALNYIQQHPEVDEVILSGGDPLVMPDQKIADLLERLATIEHVNTIRIHSRIPSVVPGRITEEFVHILANTPKNVIIVMHINHPDEIADDVASAANKLKTNGILLLNQSVLLAGINDNANTLCALSHKLFSINVLPYYLHMLDPVQGSAHFAVDMERARQIHQQVKNRLSGYLVPKLVQEIKGHGSKTTVL